MPEEIKKAYQKNSNAQNKKHQSVEPSLSPKYTAIAPSREFNNPIYAGFDINEQNKQHQNWGPWVIGNPGGIKHSYSLHSNIKKIVSDHHQPQYRAINQNKKDKNMTQNNNQHSQKVILNRRSHSRNQLPEIKQILNRRSHSRNQLLEIKQKYKPTLIQFKQCSAQLLNKKLTLKKQISNKPTIAALQKNDRNLFRRNIEPLKDRIKIKAVVYNYCTNDNADNIILNSNRKSQAFISKDTNQKQRQIKQQMMLSRYEGLKAYWKRRNTTHKVLGL